MILWLIVFLAGAVLMGLELAGSRVLAPYFGGSIFVWGSLIGTFLAALSAGYYLGGRIADRAPRAWVLGSLLLLASILILLIPPIFPAVCQAIVSRDFGPRLNPLLATLSLFFFPSLLMGTTSPFAVKLAASNLAAVGGVAGTLYALSTVGSIAGTLGTAFYLIPALGTRAILYLLAASLLITASLVFLVHLRGPRIYNILPCLLLLLSATSPCRATSPLLPEGAKILLERDSAYHRIFVYDLGGSRYLRCDNVLHGKMPVGDIYGEGLGYTNYFDLAFLFKQDIRKVLFIGLGSGTGAKRFLRNYPGVRIDVAEIDPVIIQVAKRYFGARESERLKIHAEDGRLFLLRSRQKYDAILLDAYYRDSLPFHLTTQEFFQLVKKHLTEGGVLVNNIIGPLEGSKNKLFRSIFRTEKVVFGQVYVFPVWLEPMLATPPDPRAPMNIMLVALNSRRSFLRQDISQKARELQGKLIPDPLLIERASALYDKKISDAEVRLLTDNYAPVDALIHLW